VYKSDQMKIKHPKKIQKVQNKVH